MRGFDAERWLMARLGGPDDLELFRDALTVRLLPDAGPPSWWADRFRFLRSAIFTPLRVRRTGGEALASPRVAFDPAAGREGMREYRRFFVEHHFGQRLDFVGRGQVRSAPRATSYENPRWFRWYLTGVAGAVLAWFDLGPTRYAWWSQVFADVQAYLRVLGGIETVYCFGLYDRRPYVLAAFLHRHTDVRVYLVYQNIPLYRNCRHLHMRVPVVLTSKVNLPEAEYFGKLGTFNPSEIIYKSQEFALDIVGLQRSAPVFDIGFFSSGEWARKGGLYQSDDVEAIRSGAFEQNEYAAKAQEIVRSLAEYAAERGLTLHIYPHPLERRLSAENGVAPPYASLVDGRTVTMDEGAEHSRRNIYEARVAVSLQSSFIWERLDLELAESYIYEWSDPERNPFLRAALGPYAENLFRDMDELGRKLDLALAER